MDVIDPGDVIESCSKGRVRKDKGDRLGVALNVTFEMSKRCENASHAPVKDSVFELRTRMARMLSIVEITSQRNNPVSEYRLDMSIR